MNAASRDEPIMRLHNRGYTPAQIGKVVGRGAGSLPGMPIGHQSIRH
jgi:hypothetical protein